MDVVSFVVSFAFTALAFIAKKKKKKVPKLTSRTLPFLFSSVSLQFQGLMFKYSSILS